MFIIYYIYNIILDTFMPRILVYKGKKNTWFSNMKATLLLYVQFIVHEIK